MRMSLIERCIRKLGIGRKSKAGANHVSDGVRIAFQARYCNFRLLLSANNKALRIMSEFEDAVKGYMSFGMPFIRSNCTALTVSVFQMIRYLEQLAPGSCPGLFDSFRSIRGSIAEVLSQRKDTGAGPLIIFLRDMDKTRADEAGNKMANLGELRNHLGIRVPNGFVISSHAFREFIARGNLQTEIDRLVQSSPTEEMDRMFSLSAQIQQRIMRTEVPPELEKAILSAYTELEKLEGQGAKVSLRSSAFGEDSGRTSFAGLYRSELNVSAENLIRAYKETAASKYSLPAIIYRRNRGIRDEDVDMCVGCTAMVNAAAGGVVYSRNPIDARDARIFVYSVFGFPKSVVDGRVASDLFVLSAQNPPEVLEKQIAEKRYKFICYPDEGVCRLDTSGDEASRASIPDRIAVELARIVMRIERHYGFAQDVEWVLDENGEIVIVQCRPLGLKDRPSGAPPAGPNVEDGEILLSGGITGSPGAACGPVFTVRKESDSLFFPEGAVLVVKQALPRWAALLGRASALVAEQGTAAGHLANVAREFDVPAILGLPGAVDLLENGRQVTVDARGRRVFTGRMECLLRDPPPSPRDRLAGSPVLETLRRVSDNIVPLHMRDAGAPDFIPSRCRTFHDIINFCHEKSVIEMFSFGMNHRFRERAGKQLVCRIPMQWWVLNLDDGFREDVPGKFVDLENIVSVPMLALWEGIVAVPWEGPPPVDSKGFMSIIMEASSNPALDPSMPSPYADRNYFMISRNFCCLNSRFGFHFSNIEAFVSERANDNYISFSFKGGAADYGRRVRRARFIGGILEEFEFRSEIYGDGVMSRLEGYDEDEIKEKLKILGYLIIHTRQLDMVMFNEASCHQLRGKLLADIFKIVLSKAVDTGSPGQRECPDSAARAFEPRSYQG